jgi:hypothetical protein
MCYEVMEGFKEKESNLPKGLLTKCLAIIDYQCTAL